MRMCVHFWMGVLMLLNPFASKQIILFRPVDLTNLMLLPYTIKNMISSE